MHILLTYFFDRLHKTVTRLLVCIFFCNRVYDIDASGDGPVMHGCDLENNENFTNFDSPPKKQKLDVCLLNLLMVA